MERIFVDTSGWVALFVERDNNHRKALAIYKELERRKAFLVTSDYVLDETVTTILRRGSHQHSVLAGDAILASKIVEIIFVAPYLKPSWEMYKKYADKKFSFTDATSFSVMKDFGIQKVFSFDRDFVQAGFELV